MQTLLFSVLILLCAIHVKSEANLDYFIMSETHLTEYRANEDDNAAFAPFYVVCAGPNFGCEPAIPVLHRNEGYVTIFPSNKTPHVYFGCTSISDIGGNVFNFEYFEKALVLRKASTVAVRLGYMVQYYLETRKQRCRLEVSPQIRITSDKRLGVVAYNIGFPIIGFGEVTLAEVHFDCDDKIPIRTKHFVHGVSLAVPTTAFYSIEELIFEGHSEFFPKWKLRFCMEFYWRFNKSDSSARNEINDYLTLNELDPIPESEKIVMAHLIPEYDMIDPSWKNVSRFAQTIIPMWEELYLGIWADVEEIIREVAFINNTKLTVFSGIHEQLVFNAGPRKRRLFYLHENDVSVPKLIWKLIIDESFRVNYKRAIIIIIRNISEKLKNLNIFAEIKPPACQKTCHDFGWTGIDKPNVYCCEVKEVQQLIKELPDIVRKENFDMLFHKYTL